MQPETANSNTQPSHASHAQPLTQSHELVRRLPIIQCQPTPLSSRVTTNAPNALLTASFNSPLLVWSPQCILPCLFLRRSSCHTVPPTLPAMSNVSRPPRRPKPAVAAPLPHNDFDDDELLSRDDDLQPATTSVQLATAMRASIASQPKLHPAQQTQHRRRPSAQARQPVQQTRHDDDYEQPMHEQQQQHYTEEERYGADEAAPSRPQQMSAFTFKPSQRPVRSRAPSYSSSSSSSSLAALTPTSMAAFDPLTTPATKTAASRALTKRSSLTLPSPRPAQLLALPEPSSHDPFDAIDPSPPSYEQVLASDDVIAAQFSGMLAIEPPAASAADEAQIRRVARQGQQEQEWQEVGGGGQCYHGSSSPAAESTSQTEAESACPRAIGGGEAR